MADNSQLKWIDYKDFTTGLWDTGASFLVPPTAFQIMDNCYPLPQGGVRAFFKPTETTLTTIGAGGSPIWFRPPTRPRPPPPSSC